MRWPVSRMLVVLLGLGFVSPGAAEQRTSESSQVKFARDDAKGEFRVLIDGKEAIVYQYDGKKHEPSHVRVLWGSQIFFGRLESMSVDNTMFKPSGEPLRAKVQLAFIGFMSKEEEALRANRSSPDMSHLIEVQAGDTLPLLCYRIYRDGGYYAEIARINDLTDFRELRPGTRLRFPPLE